MFTIQEYCHPVQMLATKRCALHLRFDLCYKHIFTCTSINLDLSLSLSLSHAAIL
jgi:xylose isomerase